MASHIIYIVFKQYIVSLLFNSKTNILLSIVTVKTKKKNN